MPEEIQSITLHLEFERGTRNPERVFTAMNGLIKSFQSADTLLARGLHLQTALSPEFLLEDITAGSLKTKLAQMLYQAADSIPEEALASGDYKKVIGALLVKWKHKLAEFLASKDKLPTQDELKDLGEDLREIVEKGILEINPVPVYVPPTPHELLIVFQEMTEATSTLTGTDRIMFESDYGDTRLQQHLSISDGDIRKILTRETSTNSNTVILQIRRPDFLGGAQWEFKHLDHPLRAKIRDEDWLMRFHKQEEVVLPGDSLRVEMTTTVSYGGDWQELEHDHTINRIVEVLHSDRGLEHPML